MIIIMMTFMHFDDNIEFCTFANPYPIVKSINLDIRAFSLISPPFIWTNRACFGGPICPHCHSDIGYTIVKRLDGLRYNNPSNILQYTIVTCSVTSVTGVHTAHVTQEASQMASFQSSVTPLPSLRGLTSLCELYKFMAKPPAQCRRPPLSRFRQSRRWSPHSQTSWRPHWRG